MKAMFLMDFITVKKLLRRYLLLLLGMGGAAALMMGSHPGIIPYFGMISVVSVAQALALYDDRRDWSRFRLTMPLTRTGVVLGRYAFLAAVAVAGTLMGVAVYLAATLAVQGVPAYAGARAPPGRLRRDRARLVSCRVACARIRGRGNHAAHVLQLRHGKRAALRDGAGHDGFRACHRPDRQRLGQAGGGTRVPRRARLARHVVRDVPRGGGRLGGERARALRCILRRMPCRLPPARFLAEATGSQSPAQGKGRPCRARRSARLGRRLRRIAHQAGARGLASPSSRGRPG
ncbi:hypothetical protein GKE55_04320 [Gordonibacter pamelaeae]|nr:hypothetical protein [Gordonibacter pamelaeae]